MSLIQRYSSVPVRIKMPSLKFPRYTLPIHPVLRFKTVSFVQHLSLYSLSTNTLPTSSLNHNTYPKPQLFIDRGPEQLSKSTIKSSPKKCTIFSLCHEMMQWENRKSMCPPCASEYNYMIYYLTQTLTTFNAI